MKKLFILLVNTDPDHADEVAAPFYMAAAAAALGATVEVAFAGRSARLALADVATRIVTHAGDQAQGGHTLYDFIRMAAEQGVRFVVCSQARQSMTGALIDEIEETVGAAWMMERALADDTVTLSF